MKLYQDDSAVNLKKIEETLSLKKKEGSELPYNDKVMLANFVKLANDDIGQTNRKMATGNFKEMNPIVAPIADNPEIMRAAGLIGQLALGKRWAEMDDKNLRSIELLIANVLEAAALDYSQKEPWMIQFGKEF